MAAPTVDAVGSGAESGTATVDVPYPSGIVAGSLLVIQALTRDGDAAPASLLATGFTAVQKVDLGNNVGLAGVFIKKATGSESGTVAVTCSGTTNGCFVGRMYRVEGWNDTGTLSDAYEAVGTAGPSGTNTITDVGITTLGEDRLACQFVFVADDNALDAFTGMTGGTWAEATPEYTTLLGGDAAIGVQTATLASAGTIDGGTDVMAASDTWAVIGFAIKPGVASGPAIRFRTSQQAVHRSVSH